MKSKILISTFFFILSHTAIAQPIVGVDGINIGMSSEEFLNTLSIKEKTLTDSADKEIYIGYSNKNKYLKRVSVASLELENSIYKVYSPGSETYETSLDLGVKSVLDNFWDIKFYFYKNMLVKIEILGATHNIEEVLSEKYGKPKIKDDFKSIVCQNGYGVRSGGARGSKSKTWGEGNKIVTQSSFSSSGCGQDSGFGFYIRDVKMDVARSKEEDAGQKDFNARLVKEKTKKAAF